MHVFRDWFPIGVTLLMALFTFASHRQGNLGVVFILLLYALTSVCVVVALVLHVRKKFQKDPDTAQRLSAYTTLTELRGAIEKHIHDEIELNRETGDVRETRWGDRGRKIYHGCIEILSHPLLEGKSFLEDFKANNGFGQNSNDGLPQQKGEFRDQFILGRHSDPVTGLKVLDAASQHLKYDTDLRAASLPLGKHHLKIQELEELLEGFEWLIQKDTPDYLDAHQLSHEHSQWMSRAKTALEHPKLTIHLSRFNGLSSTTRWAGKADQYFNLSDGRKLRSRHMDPVPTMKILQDAIEFLRADQDHT